jgi:hypothetical protein
LRSGTSARRRFFSASPPPLCAPSAQTPLVELFVTSALVSRFGFDGIRVAVKVSDKSRRLAISIGFTAAGALRAGAAARNVAAIAAMLAAAAVTYTTRLNPLWISATAALLGFAAPV